MIDTDYAPFAMSYHTMLQYLRYISPDSVLGNAVQFQDPNEVKNSVSIITDAKLRGTLTQFSVRPNQNFSGASLSAVYLLTYDDAYKIVASTSDCSGQLFQNLDDVRWLTKQGVKNGVEVFDVVNYEDCILAYSLKTSFDFSSLLKGSVNLPTSVYDIITEIKTEDYDIEYNQAYQVYDPAVCKISALPFRAYDSIYNSHYRGVSPLVKDGEFVYDEFVQNDNDGADNTDYHLYNRYWEKDFLTTAVPSPQQGLAPLVGLNTNTPYTTQQMIINGSPTNIQVQSAQDGKVIGVSYYGENVPVGSVEALEQAIDYGISINDFRNVNALQKWLK